MDLSIISYYDNVDRKLIVGEYCVPIKINQFEYSGNSATFPINELMQIDELMQTFSRCWERQMNITFGTKKLMIYVSVICGLIVTKCHWVKFEI